MTESDADVGRRFQAEITHMTETLHELLVFAGEGASVWHTKVAVAALTNVLRNAVAHLPVPERKRMLVDIRKLLAEAERAEDVWSYDAPPRP
jgi:hypothetical protein